MATSRSRVRGLMTAGTALSLGLWVSAILGSYGGRVGNLDLRMSSGVLLGVHLNPNVHIHDTYYLVSKYDSARLGIVLPSMSSMGGALLVVIPLWPPFVGCALPAAWLWVRKRKDGTNDCKQCGYDLTGNVSWRCPECGSPALVQSSAGLKEL